jgi:hypothetical protein
VNSKASTAVATETGRSKKETHADCAEWAGRDTRKNAAIKKMNDGQDFLDRLKVTTASGTAEIF